MNISQLKESKFLKKEDCGQGILVTIAAVEPREVEKDGHKETKFAVIFQEALKPMILNTTNAGLIASILGSDETDDWRGQQVVLYNDRSVMNRGQVTGGIRVRASRRPQPRSAPVPMPAPRPPPAAPMPLQDDDDSVPF